MSLLHVFVVLIVVGLLLWLVGYIPLDPTIKKIISVVAIVVVVLWLLSLFFGFGFLPHLRVGRMT